jgi:hypothetical protein
MNHVKWTARTALFAGITAVLGLVVVINCSETSFAGDRFNIGFGYRPGGYGMHGRGQYGYGHGYRSGNYNNTQNRLLLYGYGPYGYGNTTGYSGWNSNYNSYSPYTTNYYNPYSTWSYSPYGVGTYRPYGY